MGPVFPMALAMVAFQLFKDISQVLTFFCFKAAVYGGLSQLWLPGGKASVEDRG